MQWRHPEPTAWYTALLDLYGLHGDFPGCTVATTLPVPAKVEYIEQEQLRDLARPAEAAILDRYATPEHINDSPLTAPCKRIAGLCACYDNVGEDLLVLEEIGLAHLREAGPHFGAWFTRLEALV